MDIIVRRFPTLAVNIFNNLDDQSLVKFKKADRESFEFINQERFYWIRILIKYNELFETGKESWNISISKTPAGFVKKLAMAVLTYFNDDQLKEEFDLPENEQLTPLIIAAHDGDVNFFRQVKEKIFNLNQTWSGFDTSPINIVAAYKGHIALCRHLMIESEDKIFNKDRETPLLIAAAFGHLEVFKLFYAVAEVKNPTLEEEGLEGRTLLHIAACGGNSEICKSIMESEDNKNPSDNTGTTPLHIAVAKGHFDICSIIIDIITNKNPVDNRGRSALHSAALYGQLDIYKLIYRNVVDKTPRNLYGNTPLHNAASKGKLDICKFILENTAVKNPRGRGGETPLHFAAKQGHFDVCKLIFEYVDKKNPASHSGDTPLHYAALSRNDLTSKPTPIHMELSGEDHAASIGHLNVCKLFLENIDEIFPKNRLGKTPMDVAKKRNQIYIIQLFRLAAIYTPILT